MRESVSESDRSFQAKSEARKDKKEQQIRDAYKEMAVNEEESVTMMINGAR